MTRGVFHCLVFLLSPDELRNSGQTSSIAVWDASVLNLICLWAIFLSCSFSLAFEKLYKKKKRAESWLTEVFYRMFRTKCVMQGLLHLMLIVCCTLLKHMLSVWYCCDLQIQITKEHIKIFGAVSARCLKCFGGTEVDGYTSRHALPFLKD